MVLLEPVLKVVPERTVEPEALLVVPLVAEQALVEAPVKAVVKLLAAEVGLEVLVQVEVQEPVQPAAVFAELAA